MEKNKIVAIQGSFRENGVTTSMLRYAANELGRMGHEVTYLNLFEKRIEFCKGCRKCLETEECIFKNDDMPEITRYIKEAEVIILAAPVYWGNVPAIVKNLFDRLSGVAMEETAAFPNPRLKGKKYILLTSCNTPAPFSWIFGQSRGAIRNMDEFFKTAGMKPLGKIVVSNAAKRHELPKSALKKIERCFG